MCALKLNFERSCWPQYRILVAEEINFIVGTKLKNERMDEWTTSAVGFTNTEVNNRIRHKCVCDPPLLPFVTDGEKLWTESSCFTKIATVFQTEEVEKFRAEKDGFAGRRRRSLATGRNEIRPLWAELKQNAPKWHVSFRSKLTGIRKFLGGMTSWKIELWRCFFFSTILLLFIIDSPSHPPPFSLIHFTSSFPSFGPARMRNTECPEPQTASWGSESGRVWASLSCVTQYNKQVWWRAK